MQFINFEILLSRGKWQMQQCVSSQQVCANFRFWFTLPRSILYTFLFSFSMNMKTKHLTFFLFLVNCLLLFYLPTYEGRFVQPAKLHIDTVAQTVPLRKAPCLQVYKKKCIRWYFFRFRRFYTFCWKVPETIC